MATQTPHPDENRERCENCGDRTEHTVSIDLLVESSKEKNAQFSREPYRVAECQRCGTETAQRMNNA